MAPQGYGYETFLCPKCGSSLYFPGSPCADCKRGTAGKPVQAVKTGVMERPAWMNLRDEWNRTGTTQGVTRENAAKESPKAKLDSSIRPHAAIKSTSGTPAIRAGVAVPALSKLGRKTMLVKGSRDRVQDAVNKAKDVGLVPQYVRFSVKDVSAEWMAVVDYDERVKQWLLSRGWRQET
jgi:hypothetical protein